MKYELAVGKVTLVALTSAVLLYTLVTNTVPVLISKLVQVAMKRTSPKRDMVANM